MRTLFQRRVFKRIFFSYIAVIFGSMIIYTAFLSTEHSRIRKFQIERQAELQLDEIGRVFDRSILDAQNIVQNLSYSAALKTLYMNQRLETELDPYSVSLIQSELRSTMASGGLRIYKTAIFLDNSDKAYSSSGVIYLSEPFNDKELEHPYFAKKSLNDVFGFDSKRYSFQKECLIYADDYTYQNGATIGTVVILFDIDNLIDEVNTSLEDGNGVTISYDSEELISIGDTYKKTMTLQSRRLDNLEYTLHISGKVKTSENGFFIVLLLLIILVSLGFIYVAFVESKKYYLPIDRLDRIVKDGDVEMHIGERSDEADEMDDIIDGIRALIGEKNVYREKMLTISPYVKTGVLHSVMTGNMKEENIRVLSEDHYFDLVKPFFIVSAVNLYYDNKNDKAIERGGPSLREMFRTVADTFSTDEMHIVSYFRDMEHIFFIVNSDTENIEDDLFYQMQKQLAVSLEGNGCIVTMGVDTIREDINEIQDACRGAISALDGILTDGRGEVYFLDENEGRALMYYFPNHFADKLKKYLEKHAKEEICSLFKEIYDKNWELAGAPEMYRALIDELHLSVIKTLREVTQLTTTHINLEKYRSLATLEEVFDYYKAALMSIVDSMIEAEESNVNDEALSEEILAYIDENTFDSELSLQSISDRFKVSNKYLSLLCKKKYGVTYLQYLQNRRIERAAKLLSEGNYSLSEIALMCGYTNQLTFRRNFKSITGKNPSDYE